MYLFALRLDMSMMTALVTLIVRLANRQWLSAAGSINFALGSGQAFALHSFYYLEIK